MTYDDLTVNEVEGVVNLEGSILVSGSDEEGNVYESGIMLYFTQGEPSLLFDAYVAAG